MDGQWQRRTMGNHPLEGDGLGATNLFYYLWKRNKDLKGCSVMVPDTVIFDGMMPRAWYSYNSNKGELDKKGLREVSIGAVKREFSKPVRAHDPSMSKRECDIVAQYMHVSSYEDDEEVLTVEFLHSDELEDFLTKREKKGHSILQRFVPPKGAYNGMVQAVWSPNVFYAERRHNLHKLSDPRWSRFERAVTYEGPFLYSTQAFCAPKMERQIEQLCIQIVKHIYETEKKAISRMVLYFKVDPKDHVWLTYSNCLRLHDKSKKDAIPMNLAQLYAPPPTESNSGFLKTQGSHGRQVKKERATEDVIPDNVPRIPHDLHTCPNCNNSLECEGYPVTLGNVIKYSNKGKPTSSSVPELEAIANGFDEPGEESARGTEVPEEDTLLSLVEEGGEVVISDLAGGSPTNLLHQKRARQRQMVQGLFSQMDAVVYEAYSSFRLASRGSKNMRTFNFDLEMNLSLPVYEKVLAVLLSSDAIERIQEGGEEAEASTSAAPTLPGIPTASTPRNEQEPTDSSADVYSNALAAVLQPPLISAVANAHGIARLASATTPTSASPQRPSSRQSRGRKQNREKIKKERKAKRHRSRDSDDSSGSDSDSSSSSSSDSSDSSSSSESYSASASTTGTGTLREGSYARMHEYGDEPEEEPGDQHFRVDWQQMSLVKLQNLFAAAKLAGEIELWPPGHPQRRRLLERQRHIERGKRNESAPVGNKFAPLSATASQRKPAIDMTWISSGHASLSHMQSEDHSGDAGIPRVVRKLFPALNLPQYKYLSLEPAFLNQVVLCCEGCFLTFTDVSARKLHSKQAILPGASSPSKKYRSVPSRVSHVNNSACARKLIERVNRQNGSRGHLSSSGASGNGIASPTGGAAAFGI